VAQAIAEQHPAAVFVDEGGVGGGVVDRLRQLGHRVIGVNFGAKADGLVDGLRCANKRAEMWARLRDWLKTGGAIDPGPELAGDLSGVEYGFTADNAIQLERKEDMKKRGLASPDDADALALTFAFPVAPLRWGADAAAGTEGRAETDYDPFG
jgi:phage terminase large subunit